MGALKILNLVKFAVFGIILPHWFDSILTDQAEIKIDWKSRPQVLLVRICEAVMRVPKTHVWSPAWQLLPVIVVSRIQVRTMLTTESPVNNDCSSPNLWRENLEKAQHYKVTTPLSTNIYLIQHYWHLLSGQWIGTTSSAWLSVGSRKMFDMK